MPVSEFKIFVGIDQTGAVNSKGIPKSLVVTVLDAREQLRVYTSLTIPSLTQPHLQSFLQKLLPDFAGEKVLLCVDAVLGLPEDLKIKQDHIFNQIRQFTYNDKAYGALTAHQFFIQFLNSSETPHRQVERKVRANSVFKMKPFQKNISCGSYRILKDLSADTSWCSLWPFENVDKQYTIAEGYPSYFWRQVIGLKTRNLDLLHEKFTHLQFETIDQADSFVLAYGAHHFKDQITNFKRNSTTQYEGWILGVPYE